MAAVLLTAWLELPELKNFEVLEFFSGRARVSRFAARRGWQVASYDIAYHQPDENTTSNHNGKAKRSFMDMNSQAGFL